jgi:transposase
MSKSILNIFGLQGLGFSLRRREVTEEEIILQVNDESKAFCPRCGKHAQGHYEKGKLRKIYYGFGFGRRVYLLVRKERYYCQVCQRAFTKAVPLVFPWQRRTEEAEEQIIESLQGQSFRSVEEKEGIGYGVSKRILMRRLDPEKLLWTGESQKEIALGIDGHSF